MLSIYFGFALCAYALLFKRDKISAWKNGESSAWVIRALTVIIGFALFVFATINFVFKIHNADNFFIFGTILMAGLILIIHGRREEPRLPEQSPVEPLHNLAREGQESNINELFQNQSKNNCGLHGDTDSLSLLLHND
jgi:amino acid transporter